MVTNTAANVIYTGSTFQCLQAQRDMIPIATEIMHRDTWPKALYSYTVVHRMFFSAQ